MNAPYKTFRFDWLMASEHPSALLRPEDGDVEWLPYPLPPEVGEGGFQKVELSSLGMSVFRGVHRFQPGMAGKLVRLAEVDLSLPGATFMAQVVRGGSILHKELYPAGDLLFRPGLDLFRLTDRLHVVPILDASSNSEMTCLTVSLKTLEALIGTDSAGQLLHKLALKSCPQVVVRPLPLHISAHLHGAIPPHLTGAMRVLHCQARALDFLGALLGQLEGSQIQVVQNQPAKERACAIHEFLMGLEGKLPTLDELALQFGRSARVLNEEFSAAYGESIIAFISGQRLVEAHDAIQNSNVALKVLAERLGYAHVNHFSAAFRKRFGYPPGSLRRR